MSSSSDEFESISKLKISMEKIPSSRLIKKIFCSQLGSNLYRFHTSWSNVYSFKGVHKHVQKYQKHQSKAQVPEPYQQCKQNVCGFFGPVWTSQVEGVQLQFVVHEPTIYDFQKLQLSLAPVSHEKPLQQIYIISKISSQ